MLFDARVALLVSTIPVLLASSGFPLDDPVGGVPLGTSGDPVVDAQADAPELPDAEAAAWLVADLGSGDVLAARNAHQPMPPASTIKLLTALSLLPDIDREATYVATEAVASVEGSRVGLVPGERYSVEDLEHGLLLASGNDTAHALTELTGGTEAALEKMNAEAARLGAFDTIATTPDGIHQPGQVSSAYDLALIARAVLANDALAELARTRTYDFPGLDGETFQIQNQNRLLGSYDGAIGLKTGYTSDAGHTLVAAAERDGVRLVATVLNADGRAEPVAAELLDWGFAAAATDAVRPVGTLVTPDEVEEAIEQAQAGDSRAEGASGADAGDAAPSGGGLAAQPWPWAVAVGAALLVIGLARRPRRRKGRYANG